MRQLPKNTKSVFRLECWRSAGAGAIESAGMTILLLIGVRYFEFSEGFKSLIATAGSLGLLVGPLLVYWVQTQRTNISLVAQRISLIGAAFFLMMFLFRTPTVFAFLGVCAMTCSSANIPLISSYHQKFFPSEIRGRLFSRVIMIRIFTVSLVSFLAGLILKLSIDLWPYVILFFCLSYLLVAFFLSKYPEYHLERNEVHSPLSGFHWLKKDPLFLWTLVSWMIMGCGNLMMLPLRVQYLSDAENGYWLSAEIVTFILAVVPSVVRLLFVPFWGGLFDKISLFRLRIFLNLFYAAHILLFFQMKSIWGLILAGIIFGIAHSGGDVAWNLWVTRLAPSGRAADYMSVHTFLTGVRGFCSPFLGFWLLSFMSYSSISIISGILIIFASSFILRPAFCKLDLKRRIE